MYAHQVVDNAQAQINFIDNHYIPDKEKRKNQQSLRAALVKSIQLIFKSQKFHGEFDNVFQSTKALHGKRVFIENGKYMRLPYKICWFDFLYTASTEAMKFIEPGQIEINKRGLLVQSIKPDLFYIHIFNKVNDDPVFAWNLSPISYIASAGANFEDRPDVIEYLKKSGGELTPGQRKGNLLPMMVYPVPKYVKDEIINANDDVGDLTYLAGYLTLLNCKNIEADPVQAPDKLNKKRAKAGKVPLFKYHVLKLKPTTKQQKASGNSGTRLNRIHLCRGHFKEYTKDAPLFGKLTGLYWWDAHVRGERKKGIVIKDYELEKTELTTSSQPAHDPNPGAVSYP